MCLLVNVPTTFVSSTGASAVAVAVAATAAAGTSATASPVAPRAPTGISRLISFPSPIWILSVPPATVAAVATGAAGAASSAGASSSAFSSAGVVGAFTPSRTSFVNGQRESHVFVSFAPSTSSIVRHPSRFNNPESTRSSKIAGSSRFAGSIVIPASALQHSTAGS